MEGDALQVRLGNGIEVNGRARVRLDPRKLEPEAVNCISHAHSDYLPRAVNGTGAMATEITLRCASSRLSREVRYEGAEGIEMLNAGHIAGSSMFFLEGERTVLYTGDFSPRDRLGMTGAKPRKCDVLIMESTFGNPRYVFPPTGHLAGIVRDWVEDGLNKGAAIFLFAYPLGKSQRLINLLGDLAPYLHGSVFEETQLVKEDCGPYCLLPYAEDAAKAPFITICPMSGNNSSLLAYWRRKLGDGKVRTAAFSGWAADRGYSYRTGTNEGFAISDHADFEELVSFAAACSPKFIYLTHGFDELLAGHIKKRTGIEALPLKRNQTALLDF